jgi:hypothetical protein
MHQIRTLGSASLPVFCAHLVLALGALALLGAEQQHPLWLELAVLLASFWLLHRIALASLARRSAARPSGQLA